MQLAQIAAMNVSKLTVRLVFLPRDFIRNLEKYGHNATRSEQQLEYANSLITILVLSCNRSCFQTERDSKPNEAVEKDNKKNRG